MPTDSKSSVRPRSALVLVMVVLVGIIAGTGSAHGQSQPAYNVIGTDATCASVYDANSARWYTCTSDGAVYLAPDGSDPRMFPAEYPSLWGPLGGIPPAAAYNSNKDYCSAWIFTGPCRMSSTGRATTTTSATGHNWGGRIATMSSGRTQRTSAGAGGPCTTRGMRLRSERVSELRTRPSRRCVQREGATTNRGRRASSRKRR